jgi:glycosyltransferase involved in cell wall biosynthesis
VRVVIATRIFAPEPAAAAFRLTALANALVRHGDEVEVLTGRIREAEAPGVDPRVRIRRAPVLRDASGAVRGYLQYLSFDAPLLLRLLFRRRPDVVVAEPPPTTGFVVRLVCGLRRIPYVYYAADVWTRALESTDVPRPLARIVGSLERAVLRRAARVVAVSDGVAATVAELAPDAAVTVIENGVDTDVFSPDGPRVDERAPYAVYAGTTSEWQGAEVFVDAMPTVRESVPDAVIVFIGQGSAWNALQRTVRERGLSDAVRFVDQVPAPEAAAWLRGARAGLVSLRPGQGYDFAVPTKLLASAAVGAPVVFAGDPSGPAARMVDTAGLGDVVAHDASDVARALIERLRAPLSPVEWTRRSEWVRSNASLARAGERVARLLAGLGR